MKKVLITGAAGFLGSHLCDRFIKEGFYVIGMDNFNVTLHGQTNNTNTATGTINLDVRLNPSAPYVTIYNAVFYISCWRET